MIRVNFTYFPESHLTNIMSQLAAIKLIKTLSSSEKRYFKLHSKKQVGNRDYLRLFDIIDKMKTVDTNSLKEKFKRLHPDTSLDNTARYLLKLVTDSLIRSKMEKDVFFQSLQGIMRVRILEERSMAAESYKELKKVREVCSRFQQHYIEYLTYRYELDHFSASNFFELSDETLIKTQMQAKNVIKSINHIQDHYSLFELLKYRLTHTGKVSSDEEKKRLNDLMLSEMVLVAGKAKNSFASQKLHLLFQSFFFTDIGDYQSALKTFQQLNRIFEDNQELLDHPPLDYLSSLNGILDSLHMLNNYEEISFYIEKVKLLDQPVYPEYFRYQARKAVATYDLVILLGKKKFTEAIEYIQSFESNLLKAYNMVDEERQWELYFYCSLAYFCIGDLKKAHKYISEVMRDQKLHPQLMISKAIRLLNIIIHYEKGDTEYLEYEIRSYKRVFSKHGKLLRSEILILKIIDLFPDRKKNKRTAAQQTKMTKEISLLKTDRYENQLLKYFDFTEWIS